ncbi:Eco57I restriction-modification methylase domain-containing protein [Actinomadura xylanilytica]|uniref:Eco57I restriction-modification methylase domain-containing protein n=1 Tax=Actinomadura xylanilytica TaxID=887459 RepID=UPI00255AAC3A|nr:class I SAM-dependent DNA methyltransferase [Actinomadura xylanilytica]MDL4774533.1 class I SAM-dependent DNA methyltransferase [Actinomadura xylanilytica]
MTYDSIVNRGDYFSAHYLAEILPKDLKKSDGLLSRWTEAEKDEKPTPRSGLRGLKRDYFKERPYFADALETIRETGRARNLAEWEKNLHELHGQVLRALTFDAAPRTLTVERSGKQYEVAVAHAEPAERPSVIAIECGWAPDVDAALDRNQAGRLLTPVDTDNLTQIRTGDKLASWLFATDEPPRYILILCGGVVILADRLTWGEGRYLAVSLDVALGRSTANSAEIEVIAALFGAGSLLPPEEGGTEPLAELLNGSRQHAVGVSKELREGLRDSVEIIANEVLARMREQGVRPEEIMEPGAFAKELGRESLRYLYRILFLLYAEARPELGILPTDDEAYVKGYSMARLGDLIVRDLISEESRRSVHLYESLDLLFRMVNKGHNPRGDNAPLRSEGEGLRFEPLKADLFDPSRTRLIGDATLEPDEYDEDLPRIDTRLRNETLHKVLRLLMLSKGKRRERGGFISYAQLGINQLGAVYEGLMSYTGFIAKEELYEVAKNGDPKDGSWMIPSSKVDDYEDSVFVLRIDENGFKTDDRVRYRPGSFVYRLAGRDRQTSASYYTPESLTQVTVQLALRERLDQDGSTTQAREILDWTICEPALGSGAFLNEAINQVAAEYLKRRQVELSHALEPELYAEELQKVKAYIALHNSYGVDLNETAVELAEVSLWLNVMYPGLQAPWFGLHLRRGNSLIGAGRRLYGPEHLKQRAWLKSAPEDVPFRDGPIPEGRIHHFLLPAQGWGAVAGEKEAKALAPDDAKRLGDWRKKLLKDPSTKKRQGQKLTQVQRLQGLSRRAEYLWGLVIERLKISETEISRSIRVWGANDLRQPDETIPREKVLNDLTFAGTPYWRLKTMMDAWCALWFWPLDKAELLDGSAEIYEHLKDRVLDTLPGTSNPVEAPDPEPAGFPQTWAAESLFGEESVQIPIAPPKPRPKSGRKAQRVERRSVVPLADLDDWLDFAESLLGTSDIPEDSLGAHFASLSELDDHEEQLPVWMGMDNELKLGERYPWLNVVEDIAEQQGFFHWELQFAQVFQRGGFDLQVGNPPWVRPEWSETVVVAELDPWFMLADSLPQQRDLRRQIVFSSEKMVKFVTDELTENAGIDAHLGSTTFYSILNGTQSDLYRCFMLRAWASAGRAGVVGLIHPDSHFTGAREGEFRAECYRRLRLHGHFQNRRKIFPEVDSNKQFGIHVYGSIQPISFLHLSWLFDPSTLSGSLVHDGSGVAPGVKFEGDWDIRPHGKRLLRINSSTLLEWQRLTGDVNIPVEQVRLLYPVSTAERKAINVLLQIQERLHDVDHKIFSGYHETGAKAAKLIREELTEPISWDDVTLKGPQFGVATPFAKRPPIPKRGGRPMDLVSLGSNSVPRSEYIRTSSISDFRRAQETWNGRRYSEYYRVCWREWVPASTERSLFVCIIPPGPTHIHAVRSMATSSDRDLALIAGFWAALPVDYFLRVSGKNHLDVADAGSMPIPRSNHPLSSDLALISMRLNSVTSIYADLWGRVYENKWPNIEWACSWPKLAPLGNVLQSWTPDTPLRNERERRAGLVEIDSLVAVMMGLTTEELIAVYQARFPQLLTYENSMYFDSRGRRIAADFDAYGAGQIKDDYTQLIKHLKDKKNEPPPKGYLAPFYKADREAEYRQAHAVFSERLERAKAEGWTPDGGGSSS